MTNNRQSTTDGENYLSRCRVNRHVVTITGGIAESLSLNGKVSKIIIDASDATMLAPASGNIGQFRMTMDVEDATGAELLYFDQIALLNYSGASTGQVALLEVSPGSNRGTATSKNSLHFSVTTTAAATSGGTVIDEPAAWNGLVCGRVRLHCDLPAPHNLVPTAEIRVIIFLE
jgi:hypothetical protein